MHRLAGLIAICAAFCAFFVSPAAAQAQTGRGDIFLVSGVRVDQTAADGAQARTQGMAAAQRAGFERLARRITSAEDQARLTIPRPDDASLNLLVRSVDVEEERRSGTRYIGRFAVRFDPNGVRTALQAAGFQVLEARGAPVLVVTQPVPADGGVDVWRQAWDQGGFAGELLPVVVAAPTARADWPSLQPLAAAAGAQTVIVATARQTGAALVADLVEFDANGAQSPRGQASAAVQGGDAGLPDAYRRLAEAANARLQTQWKTGLTLQASQRTRIVVSALYRDMPEWTRVKQGLEQAAQTTISDIRIEAIGREGAVVTFAHSGAVEDLSRALERFNLQLAQSSQGPVLRTTGR